MESRKQTKITADIIILACSAVLLFCVCSWKPDKAWFWWAAAFLVMIMIVAAADLLIQNRRQTMEPIFNDSEIEIKIFRLILLDEQNKPVKSWDLSGKTAVVIGRRNDEEQIDVDLEDCEYSSFIDLQHAVLNFCHNSWFVEDLGSQNGVTIKKVEDGGIYKVLGRPCMIAAGDILYIANTRLLLT